MGSKYRSSYFRREALDSFGSIGFPSGRISCGSTYIIYFPIIYDSENTTPFLAEECSRPTNQVILRVYPILPSHEVILTTCLCKKHLSIDGFIMRACQKNFRKRAKNIFGVNIVLIHSRIYNLLLIGRKCSNTLRRRLQSL